ncbi:hypothetical protein Dimus_018453, partial [Dionaea muscipula]
MQGQPSKRESPQQKQKEIEGNEAEAEAEGVLAVYWYWINSSCSFGGTPHMWAMIHSYPAAAAAAFKLAGAGEATNDDHTGSLEDLPPGQHVIDSSAAGEDSVTASDSTSVLQAPQQDTDQDQSSSSMATHGTNRM